MSRVINAIVVENLSELADHAYQERVWTGNGVPEVSSPQECAERLFSDSGLQDALDRGEVYGAKADVLARKLSRIVDQVDLDREPEEILADPLVAEIRDVARNLLGLVQESTSADGVPAPDTRK